jgi:hypothetical protein
MRARCARKGDVPIGARHRRRALTVATAQPPHSHRILAAVIR